MRELAEKERARDEAKFTYLDSLVDLEREKRRLGLPRSWEEAWEEEGDYLVVLLSYACLEDWENWVMSRGTGTGPIVSGRKHLGYPGVYEVHVQRVMRSFERSDHILRPYGYRGG